MHCSFGLHCGTRAYAVGYGSIILTVKVNPADAVSVPSDSDCQKIRVCRYLVVATESQDFDSAVFNDQPTLTVDQFENAKVLAENLGITVEEAHSRLNF